LFSQVVDRGVELIQLSFGVDKHFLHVFLVRRRTVHDYIGKPTESTSDETTENRRIMVEQVSNQTSDGENDTCLDPV
jgi:hypothetical protein